MALFYGADRSENLARPVLMFFHRYQLQKNFKRGKPRGLRDKSGIARSKLESSGHLSVVNSFEKNICRRLIFIIDNFLNTDPIMEKIYTNV